MLRSRKHFLTCSKSTKNPKIALENYVKRMTRYTIEYAVIVEEQHLDGTPHLHLVGRTVKQPKVSFEDLEKIFGKHSFGKVAFMPFRVPLVRAHHS